MGWTTHQTDQDQNPDPSDPDAQVSNTPNAFIGKGVKFTGDITYSGTIRIDGILEGEVHTEGCLLVGEGAVVTASVSAGTLISKGTMTGDIIVKEKARLRSPAVVNGTILTPSLSMEEGVLLNGTVTMERSDTIPTALGAPPDAEVVEQPRPGHALR